MSITKTVAATSAVQSGPQKWYMPYLLFIAGMGGLLYGIDVGVIAGALPYLEATSGYTPGQLSMVVAAVLLGSVFSSLFAGALSDALGRKWMMILSGVCFVASVPVICIPTGFEWLLIGRLLQGASAGFIGVVVPLYLAECLNANRRGMGTAMFQFLLTIGLVLAAAIGLYFASQVDAISLKGTAEQIYNEKVFAWKAIFWACAIPGVIFTLGAFFVSESPRWLFRRGQKDKALKVLRRSRSEADAQGELREMEETQHNETNVAGTNEPKAKDSLFSKKYVVPFVLAIVILACNQATGINSVLAYIVNILNQAGLPGAIANQGDLCVKILNCVMTIVAILLVDRKGRKFLLTIGTSGIIIALLGVAFLFVSAEKQMAEYTPAVSAAAVTLPPSINDAAYQAEFTKYSKGITLKDIEEKEFLTQVQDTSVKISKDNNFAMLFTPEAIAAITKQSKTVGITDSAFVPTQVKLVYNYGGFSGNKTIVVRSFENLQNETDTEHARRLKTYLGELNVKVARNTFFTTNDDSVIGKFFRKFNINPFPNPNVIEKGEFKIEKLEIGPVPDETHGWLVTICFAIFISAFAVGPGVCVWLALSELMPTRIRSNGMSIALLVNQFVSTSIAAVFLPVVGTYGYSTIFFFCAGCTVIYFITAAFFLPETKGKTLEEIEEHFEGKRKL